MTSTKPDPPRKKLIEVALPRDAQILGFCTVGGEHRIRRPTAMTHHGAASVVFGRIAHQIATRSASTRT